MSFSCSSEAKVSLVLAARTPFVLRDHLWILREQLKKDPAVVVVVTLSITTAQELMGVVKKAFSPPIGTI